MSPRLVLSVLFVVFVLFVVLVGFVVFVWFVCTFLEKMYDGRGWERIFFVIRRLTLGDAD